MNAPHRTRRRAPRRDQEGAALLVVMMILLMVTATATFAIHATATEVRAAGNARMAMQTGYLGETAVLASLDWVDRVGPRVLVDLMESKEGQTPLDLAPFEPPLAPNRYAHRLYIDDLDPYANPGVELVSPRIAPPELFGARNAYAPLALVDVYDVHVYTGVVAGFSATGGTAMKHVRATYTARGRARLADAEDGVQLMHEAAGDARAVAISGPFGM